MKIIQRLFRLASTMAVATILASLATMPAPMGRTAHAQSSAGVISSPNAIPTVVEVDRSIEGGFQYTVDGIPQLFVGMGYNPIYRFLSDQERAANYDRDFRILCWAGVNHITGWDADKGYDQDKFDELTLEYAHKYGLGVVMPFYLPPEGDYGDADFQLTLFEAAQEKIARFRDHPALKMWGLGNEVLVEMESTEERIAFSRFYVGLADLFRELDPNHPVIYREAEDIFADIIIGEWGPPEERPWLLYGTNAYTMGLERLLDDWPVRFGERPLIVTEFGAEPYLSRRRSDGYLDMWQMIRARPSYVLGGAPYVWTTDGPEPTDAKWGLMNANGWPIDETFLRLAEEWRSESNPSSSCR